MVGNGGNKVFYERKRLKFIISVTEPQYFTHVAMMTTLVCK